jgi:hypothetical protein
VLPDVTIQLELEQPPEADTLPPARPYCVKMKLPCLAHLLD